MEQRTAEVQDNYLQTVMNLVDSDTVVLSPKVHHTHWETGAVDMITLEGRCKEYHRIVFLPQLIHFIVKYWIFSFDWILWLC